MNNEDKILIIKRVLGLAKSYFNTDDLSTISSDLGERYGNLVMASKDGGSHVLRIHFSLGSPTEIDSTFVEYLDSKTTNASFYFRKSSLLNGVYVVSAGPLETKYFVLEDNDELQEVSINYQDDITCYKIR